MNPARDTVATDTVVVFPRRCEFETAKKRMDSLGLPHAVLSPDPGYSLVGTPALICGSQGLAAIQSRDEHWITVSGWVDYRVASAAVPRCQPQLFREDIFREAVIMFVGPCVADEARIRLIAHISGDLAPVLPYLNAQVHNACFNAASTLLTFMDKHRLVALYARRITIAKADDVVDGWRTLEFVRVLANTAWEQREAIRPLYEMRSKPPVLEIYKRLPRTNCKACGEQTCMAFAARLWRGEGTPSECRPAFSPEYEHLRGALIEICMGLGIVEAFADETP